MTIALRGVVPDPMGWALGRAIFDLTPQSGGPWTWEDMLESSRLWHARRAQWYLDHTDRGPGQWPTAQQLVDAEVLWDATEYPGVLPRWEDYSEDERRILLQDAQAAIDSARHIQEVTP